MPNRKPKTLRRGQNPDCFTGEHSAGVVPPQVLFGINRSKRSASPYASVSFPH
jgi:hypothetical protein